MVKLKRRQLLVDRKVQGTLAVRAVVYWGFCLLALTLMLLCWRIATGPPMPFDNHVEEMWRQFAPAAMASVLLLLVIIVDVLWVSNRFAGPMFRLRKSMRRLARGEQVDPIQFREGDFWREFADDFNGVLARFQREQELAAESQKATDTTADKVEMLAAADG